MCQSTEKSKGIRGQKMIEKSQGKREAGRRVDNQTESPEPRSSWHRPRARRTKVAESLAVCTVACPLLGKREGPLSCPRCLPQGTAVRLPPIAETRPRLRLFSGFVCCLLVQIVPNE